MLPIFHVIQSRKRLTGDPAALRTASP